jgi:hypothetical protein
MKSRAIASAAAACVMMGSALPQSAADVPGHLACVSVDTYWIWYGEGLKAAPPGMQREVGQNLVGSRLLAPEGRFRLQDGKLYLVDGFQNEYLYGTTSETAPRRLSAGNFTIMFDPKFQSAISVRVDEFDTRVESFKCIPG